MNFLYRELSVIKQHQLYTNSSHYHDSFIGHASCTRPNKRVCLVLDEKSTVLRVIIKVTEKLVIIRITNISTHFGVYSVITRSLLKHTDLNFTEFWPKPLLFHEDCASYDLSQDPSDKIANYEVWNYSLRSTLQFALFKIKIRLLESDQKCLRHVSSTKPHLSLCERDNTTKKILFWKNKFTMEHWTS